MGFMLYVVVCFVAIKDVAYHLHFFVFVRLLEFDFLIHIKTRVLYIFRMVSVLSNSSSADHSVLQCSTHLHT